ncbi:uncharacterized protein LOC111086206, partial [Limulus polyphemus]|uniref:Uncharacterized protein LOC111086206 n=1 Tax=Limulus polyphemus TaxID=6850 RepID=A0ABM1SJK1_LIMPO
MAKVGSASSGRAYASEENIYTIPTCFHHIPHPLDMKGPQELYRVGTDNPTYRNSEVGLIIPHYAEKHSLKKPTKNSAPTCAILENYPCLKFWKLRFKTEEASLRHRTIVLFLALLVVLLILVLGIAMAVYIAAGGSLNWKDSSSDPREE